MTEETALMIQSPHLMPAMSMANAIERFNAMNQFVKQVMKEGVDYGKVPGTDKNTLFKPGAEKLTTFFGLTTKFQTIEKTEDWTGQKHEGEPFFYYWFRCELWRGDFLIAQADGSCNSWETKYRYRQGKRKCPNCGEAAIIKGKEEYGGGWLCWVKRGGCGSKFKDDDKSITGQEIGRVLNPDPADVVNTIKKMAQKRALVATTLLAVNASEFFTQDLEDLELDFDAVTPIPFESIDSTTEPPPTINGKAGKKKAHRPLDSKAVRTAIRQKAGWTNGHRLDSEPITEKQIGLVAGLMNKAVKTNGATEKECEQRRHALLDFIVGVSSTHKLTKREASAIIDWLTVEDGLDLNEFAHAEVATVYAAWQEHQGQMAMELDE